jgi:hypothetical protein
MHLAPQSDGGTLIRRLAVGANVSFAIPTD